MTGKQSIEADCVSGARSFRLWIGSVAFHTAMMLSALDSDFARLALWCAAWTGVSAVLAARRLRRGWQLQQLLEHAADCPHSRARLSEPVGG